MDGPRPIGPRAAPTGQASRACPILLLAPLRVVFALFSQPLSMRVWFNRHFELIYRVLQLIRQGDVDRRFTLLCTHKAAHFVGYAAAHEYAVEPAGLSTPDYVAWCLDFARAQRVDVFVPAFEAAALVSAGDLFAAQGTRLLTVADARTLPRLHDKAWVYGQMEQRVPLAAHQLLHHGDGLVPAAEALWSQELEACIKPTVSIYGRGFHRLLRPQDTRRSLRGLWPTEWIQRYAPQGDCAPQLVLEYLPGHEYSVDCIGDAGRLVTGVVRKKAITSNTQLLDDNPALLAHAAQLVAQFRLSGLVNIQFKTDRLGQPKLLEINPRASGGVAMSCLSGVNLPYLALCGALDGYLGLQIPEPRLGLRVTEVGTAVVISDGR